MSRTEIRSEVPSDFAAIRRVNELAFGGPEEADLVEQLRASGLRLHSLVLEEEEGIAGHILFSPVDLGCLHGPRAGARGLRRPFGNRPLP